MFRDHPGRQHGGQPAASNQSGLAAPVAELEPVVQNEPVCNIDETSGRQVGASKRPWLWTVVTAQVTLFRIAPRRSSQIARDLLGET
jgi:hypothetical protein